MKYYTPDIEEFHVGFEFEGLVTEYGHQGWGLDDFSDAKSIYEVIQHLQGKKHHPYYDDIRVKYLDQEDIESLGFEPSCTKPKEWFHRPEEGGSVQLYFDDKVRKEGQGIRITIYNDGIVVFNGYIKNKSELRRLLQQLNILQ